MTSHWVWSLVVAGAVALVATPIARQVALTVGLIDHPGPAKSHRRPTAYLGGVAIALAVLTGGLAGPSWGLREVVIACTVVLVVLGLFDDARSLPRTLRVCIEVGCAAAVIVAGIQIRYTGIVYLDVAITVVFLASIANAMNLLDNLDGLAAGVTAAGAAGVLVLTVLRHHAGIAGCAASLVGACLGFLVFNGRRATIFMGDAGSLFLGFVLAMVAVDAGSSLSRPANFVFPLLIVGLPITDTTTVIVARLRNGRSVVRGGKDHLSHRLSRAGLGPGRAVIVLVAVEACLAGLGVAIGRRVLAPWIAAAVGTGVLAVLVAAASRVQVYEASVQPPAEASLAGGAPVGDYVQPARPRVRPWAAGMPWPSRGPLRIQIHRRGDPGRVISARSAQSEVGGS